MIRAAWKKAGFKQNPNRNASFYWFCLPGDKSWRKAFKPQERAERLLWRDACMRVQRSARRAGNADLVRFAGEFGYGCYLFHLAGGDSKSNTRTG